MNSFSIYSAITSPLGLSIVRVILCYILCLIIGTLWLLRLKSKYRDNLDSISSWQRVSGFYYTFIYSLLGMGSLFGLMICGIPMIIAFIFRYSFSIFWKLLIPITTVIILTIINPYFIKSKDIAEIWGSENNLIKVGIIDPLYWKIF